MSGQPNLPDLELVQIGPGVLAGMFKDRLGKFGVKVWKFYTDLKMRLAQTYSIEKLTWQLHESAFTTRNNSAFMICGFATPPDSVIQEVAASLDPSINLSVRKFHTNDGKYNIIFTFVGEEEKTRDLSPRRTYKTMEEIPITRKSDKVPAPPERRRRKLSSSDGSASDSEEESKGEVFRRSKTPGRSASISRKGVLNLEEKDARKLSRELAQKNALLVEVEPAPEKKGFWPFSS